MWSHEYLGFTIFPKQKMAVCQFQTKVYRFFISDFHAKINNDSKYANYRFLRQPSNLKIILLRHIFNF